MTVRAALRTFAVAVGATAVLMVGSFAVQAAVLGRPGGVKLLLVGTVGKLDRYTSTRARMSLAGTHFGTVCRRSVDENRVRVGRSRVLVEDGTHLLDAGPVGESQFELAGCPDALRGWIVNSLTNGTAADMVALREHGRRLIRVRLPDDPRIELTIAVSSGLPVAIRLRGRHLRGGSAIRLGGRRR